jgi:HEAT repeat protein
MILGDVGDGAEEGVPYLVLALKDRDPLERVLAAQSLKWLGSPARSALPAMIEALRKPRLPIALVQTIGSFGSEAAAAVPALETSLSSASQNERWAAAVALHLIVPSHVQARTMLAGALTSTNDPMARESALGALQRITTGATNLVPEVREAARNPDGTLNIGAIEVLRRMSTDAAIDFLLERLSDDQPEVQLQSAGWLLRIEPRNWQARTFLMEFLKSPLLSSNRYVRWREFAIQQLAEASPDAADAIALLKKIAGNRNDAASRAAEAALKRIQKPQDF